MATPKKEFHLPLNSLYWMLSSLVLVVLPHAPRLPLWIPPVFLLFVAWRYIHARRQWPLPGKWLRFFLVVGVVLGIIISYRSLVGRDVGIALLILLLGLKLLEMKSLREARLICFLSYFLIITHFLYSQSIPTALYLALVMLATTTTLVCLSDLRNSLSLGQRVRLASGLLVQAVPLMLICFILFPRIDGPFWTLPEDRRASKSGMSDRMSLGSISNLSLSDEVAFRVKFNGDIPPPNQLYWRGAVLWDSDGQEWTRGQSAGQGDPRLQVKGPGIEYTLTLEPHGQAWVYALELPRPEDVSQDLGWFTADYDIRRRHPVNTLQRYSLRAYPDYQTEFTGRIQQQRQLGLGRQLPNNFHPRTRALAAQWQQQNPDPQALVERALQHFNQQNFHYTLSPPPLLNDPIDEFLFDTQAGFCEHYSAAFVVLMRAAGVPARVVVGYQGGSLNPLDNYLIVRQRDAHAWAEVWLEDQGWVRIDPTAAVSPSRVEMGIDSALPDAGLGFGIDDNNWLSQTWRQLRYGLDAINNGWNQWVLGYGETTQRQLLDWLGLEDWDYKNLTLALMSLLGIGMLLVAAWLWRNTLPAAVDPAQRHYLRFCRKLRTRQLLRQPGESAQHFAQRISAAYPELTDDVWQITDLYLALRYQPDSPVQLAALKRAVRQFSP